MDMPTGAIATGLVGRQRLIRDLNLRAVYERLAVAGPSARADLARELSLSATSVGRLVDDLMQAGLVVEGERVPVGVGRPQTLLHARPDAAVVAGLSIRSRSLRLHLADLDGTTLHKTRIERTDSTPKALATQVAETVQTAASRYASGIPIAAVVIGVSGVWDESRRRIYAAPNLSILEDVDAHALFSRALGEAVLAGSILIENDINLAAIGEHAHGAAFDVSDFFYLSLGSGVGGAAVVGGTVQRGASGFAGELGYLPVHVDGGVTNLESVVSRAALERFARSVGVPFGDGDVFAVLDEGGAEASQVADRVGAVLGQALASVVTTLDPRRIVLGGGVGKHSDAWTARIRGHLGTLVPVVPEIVATALGREASLLGAVAQARATARTVLVTRVADA